MSYNGNPGVPKHRYVNRAEKLEQERARALMFQEALEAAKALEGTPASSICHFEPLWQVCPDAEACSAWRDCLRLVARGRSVQAARAAVLIERAGL